MVLDDLQQNHYGFMLRFLRLSQTSQTNFITRLFLHVIKFGNPDRDDGWRGSSGNIPQRKYIMTRAHSSEWNGQSPWGNSRKRNHTHTHQKKKTEREKNRREKREKNRKRNLEETQKEKSQKTDEDIVQETKFMLFQPYMVQVKSSKIHCTENLFFTLLECYLLHRLIVYLPYLQHLAKRCTQIFLLFNECMKMFKRWY